MPPTAVAVAPVLDYGDVSRDLAWMTRDGIVGWTRDSRRTRVFNTQGEPVWTAYDAALEPLAYESLVATYRNTAVVVHPPTGEMPPDVPPDDLPTNWATEWTQFTVDERMGVPEDGNSDPVRATCPGRTAVLLRTDVPQGGTMVVDGDGTAQRLTGDGMFTHACAVLDAGPSLRMVSTDSTSEAVELRSTLVYDTLAVSRPGDRVAVVKAGFPIEILSTAPADELPSPWDVTTAGYGTSGAVVALGEREVFMRPEGLVIATASGHTDRTKLPELSDLAAARPDGTGAAVVEHPSRRLLLVSGDTVTPSTRECWGETVRYLPARDFADSYSAAEAQLPVASTGHGRSIDCRTGREISLNRGVEVLSYDVGQDAGRIVARSGEDVSVTTWVRGDRTSLRTTSGPAVPDDNNVSFDPTGQHALTYAPGRRDLILYRREGDKWRTALNVVTSLPDVVAAEVVDDGTLVLAVSTTGAFELFDTETGRQLAADPGLVLPAGRTTVSGMSARRVRDNLHVSLLATDRPDAVATIRIPIGIPTLARQLCTIYAPESLC